MVEKSAGAIIFRKEGKTPLFLLLHYPSRQAKRGARRFVEPCSSYALHSARADEAKLQRTSCSRAQKEYWDLPKGHIEKGEKPEDAAKRETEEETGLADIKFVKGFKETIRYFFKFEGKDILKFVTFYLAETKIKKIRVSSEHLGFEWLAYEEALAKLTFKNAKEILKKANDHLRRNVTFS